MLHDAHGYNTQVVWEDELNPDDIEIIEHDEAHGVFRSPRPSQTLDELQQSQIRELLMKGCSTEGDNVEGSTEAWNTQPSHADLTPHQDTSGFLGHITEDSNPWKLVGLPSDDHKGTCEKGGIFVSSAAPVLALDSVDEQSAWEETAVDRQEEMFEEIEVDEEFDLAGFINLTAED